MKVMLIGARGQLGTDLVKALAGWEIVPLTHADIEVCNADQVRDAIAQHVPEVVINTAAFHKVEECEAQPEKSFAVNALAVRQLAQTCAMHNAVLVHMSTDYVFSGSHRRPYTETDVPRPLNVYGVSKLAGEHFVQEACPRHFIIRTSGLYGVAGASGKGGNFPELMIRLARERKPIRVVTDQVLTPTYTLDVARQLRQLIPTAAYGLYHVSSGGQCSWYEFAGRIFRLLKLDVDFEPTNTAAFGAKVRRPDYSVLSHDALLAAGCPAPRPWEEALEAYLFEKGHLKARHARAA
jgi:dTDP-4-dehydrorhamnose reductase